MFEISGGVSFRAIVSSIARHFKIRKTDIHTVEKDNVTELKKPETFVEDPITDVPRSGSKKLLSEALEAEIEKENKKVRQLYK